MKIIPFPKDRWTGGPYPEGHSRPATDDYHEPDAFEREIELARDNEPLMQMLERRARSIASISLDEVKKRISGE